MGKRAGLDDTMSDGLEGLGRVKGLKVLVLYALAQEVSDISRVHSTSARSTTLLAVSARGLTVRPCSGRRLTILLLAVGRLLAVHGLLTVLRLVSVLRLLTELGLLAVLGLLTGLTIIRLLPVCARLRLLAILALSAIRRRLSWLTLRGLLTVRRLLGLLTIRRGLRLAIGRGLRLWLSILATRRLTIACLAGSTTRYSWRCSIGRWLRLLTV